VGVTVVVEERKEGVEKEIVYKILRSNLTVNRQQLYDAMVESLVIDGNTGIWIERAKVLHDIESLGFEFYTSTDSCKQMCLVQKNFDIGEDITIGLLFKQNIKGIWNIRLNQ